MMPGDTRGRGRRSRAEAAITRERLLDGAERLFADRGYRGVSVRELAAAANVRPFTIQNHFGSKLGLYKAVLGRWDQEVLECVASSLKSHDDPIRVMEAIVDELFDLLLSRSDWVKVTTRAALGDGTPRDAELRHRNWAQVVEKAIREKHLDSVQLDRELLVMTIESILNTHVLSIARRHAHAPEAQADSEDRARIKAHVKRVILALTSEVMNARPGPPESTRSRSARGRAPRSTMGSSGKK